MPGTNKRHADGKESPELGEHSGRSSGSGMEKKNLEQMREVEDAN